MSYRRVIPRDLFNESKLLKCLGRLALLHVDGMLGEIEVALDSPIDGFLIDRDASGDLRCSNLRVTHPSGELELYSTLNSNLPYPLVFRIEGCDDEYVFDEFGELTPEFKRIYMA